MKANSILPVKGAARYFAQYDTESKKYACWMEVSPDDEDKYSLHKYYVCSKHRTPEQAEKAAETMQKKENKSVLKNSLQ